MVWNPTEQWREHSRDRSTEALPESKQRKAPGAGWSKSHSRSRCSLQPPRCSVNCNNLGTGVTAGSPASSAQDRAALRTARCQAATTEVIQQKQFCTHFGLESIWHWPSPLFGFAFSYSRTSEGKKSDRAQGKPFTRTTSF